MRLYNRWQSNISNILIKMPFLRSSPHNSESSFNNQEESSGFSCKGFKHLFDSGTAKTKGKFGTLRRNSRFNSIMFLGGSPTKNESTRLISTAIIGITFGFLIGNLLVSDGIFKVRPPFGFSCTEEGNLCIKKRTKLGGSEIYVPTNPRGAERLPAGIVVPNSDLYLHRLWGDPTEDLPIQQKYLVAFTVGFDQRENINASVGKFSENFTILLFHYDGRTSEWSDFEWFDRVIHVTVARQTKWWYAKRFLHPDIVASYDYIFIWDEDIWVDNFNAEMYVELVKKHGLEISQPALESNPYIVWEMTRRRNDTDVHKETEEMERRCEDPHISECNMFVEIMAPVFSRDAWRCVWHMIQNDLVHGWGLDIEFRKCAKPNHEKMGVVDSQWIIHQHLPTLGKQGQAVKGKTKWQSVKERCFKEWGMFRSRMANATIAYYEEVQNSVV